MKISKCQREKLYCFYKLEYIITTIRVDIFLTVIQGKNNMTEHSESHRDVQRNANSSGTRLSE